jgi:hypothetical protein
VKYLDCAGVGGDGLGGSSSGLLLAAALASISGEVAIGGRGR